MSIATRSCRTLFIALTSAGALVSATAFADDASAVDPQAIKALSAMGAKLRSLTDFTVTSDSTTDMVSDDGQAVQFAHHTVLSIRRPDRMYASVKGDDGTKSMYFDGAHFTLYGTKNNYYATVPAPSTLRDLITDIHDKYGLEAPLVDLFAWGNDDERVKALSSALTVGDERLGGQICTHYALRQEGVDWQIWIRKSADPLPCKLIVTDTSNAARPQHASVLTWQLKPVFKPGLFQFKPPKGARPIVFQTNDASAPASAN
ncbi:DUF2092 domain-containing protein [Silvimonas iriomotensis]|uniref:DUF2092 domain-containing protein n=1 Tax=Silvimonas iriomotensis TaxID=449662 RepID=A0ABQ2P456_9NEIS|nr:DUF2092 domain-containing protein [Silvimonas iriomotensis]GGP17819.1 hypothetical protein GCM10010970_01710 [Silvimonas iriomotensis]